MFGQDSYKYFYKFMKTYEMLSFVCKHLPVHFKNAAYLCETAPIFTTHN